MERKSTSSVSRARVHYYAGLCLEKLNRFDEARAEFKNGTKYNMSFYGQLSSAKSEPLIRQVSRNNITQTPNISKDSAEYKKIENHELIDIVKILKKYNENSLVDIFALRLSYIFYKKYETIALSLLFKDLGKPNLAVVLSRKMRII